MTKKKIFISWSAETKSVAEAFKKWIALTNPAVDSWLSTVDIAAGKSWQSELDKGLASSNEAIICIGPSALTSIFVMYEIGALASRNRIIPVLLHATVDQLPDAIRGRQCIVALKNNSFETSVDFINHLKKSLQLDVGEINHIDKNLTKSIDEYSTGSVQSYIGILMQTKRIQLIVPLLRHIREDSPLLHDVADNRTFKQLFGMRYLSVAALLFLHNKGFITIQNFGDITQGNVKISYIGELVLDYIDRYGVSLRI